MVASCKKNKNKIKLTLIKFPWSKKVHLSLDDIIIVIYKPIHHKTHTHTYRQKKLSQLEVGSEEDLSSVLILTVAFWSLKDLQWKIYFVSYVTQKLALWFKHQEKGNSKCNLFFNVLYLTYKSIYMSHRIILTCSTKTHVYVTAFCVTRMRVCIGGHDL